MPTILLIDDDPAVRKVLRIALEVLGHAVLEAGEGKRGARIFRENAVDLVFCDLFMPDQEGLETIKQLREGDAGAKIIAMSGGRTDSPLFLRVASHAGANRLLEKPFALAAIRDLVNELLPADAAAPGRCE